MVYVWLLLANNDLLVLFSSGCRESVSSKFLNECWVPELKRFLIRLFPDTAWLDVLEVGVCGGNRTGFVGTITDNELELDRELDVEYWFKLEFENDEQYDELDDDVDEDTELYELVKFFEWWLWWLWFDLSESFAGLFVSKW